MNMDQMALETLRKLLQLPNCNWTSNEQRKAALLATEGKRDVLVALPTGTGKSMIPILAATLANKTFVVIVPLISLLEDWVRRLKTARVQYSIFEPGMRAFFDCPIILATTDVAVKDDFADAIGRAHAKNTFGGLVFDEVHEVLVSNDFRACMGNLWKIRRLPFPIISMSGTVPVNMEKSLITELCLERNTVVIRQSSNRPELLYRLEPPLEDPVVMTDQIEYIIKREDLQPKERGLVFVTNIKYGALLAEHLGCDFYSGDNRQYMSENKEKMLGIDACARAGADARKAIVNRWREGLHQIMVATTAFASGNDFPHIRVVILASTPFDMSSAIQEMGRAGRDGMPASCYIIPSRVLPQPSERGSLDFKGHQAMLKMLWKSNDCIRLCLTRYVDGDNGVSCRDDANNVICSRCHLNEKNHTIVSSDLLGSPICLRPAAEDWSISRRYSTKTPGPVHRSPLGRILVPNSSSVNSMSLVCLSSHGYKLCLNTFVANQVTQRATGTF